MITSGTPRKPFFSNTPSGGEVGSFFGPGRLQRPPRRPRSAPRGLQDGPRDAPRGPKTAQERSKRSEDGPKTVQEAPKTPEVASKRLHKRARGGENHWFFDCFRRFSRFSHFRTNNCRKRPTRLQRSSQDGPRGPQKSPKTAREGPKTAQEGPGTAREGPKTVPREPQESPKRLPKCPGWGPPRRAPTARPPRPGQRLPSKRRVAVTSLAWSFRTA